MSRQNENDVTGILLKTNEIRQKCHLKSEKL
jgi:hypothetical protein